MSFDQQHAIDHLHTVQDYIRLAASHFARAELSYGHGTDNAVDEAIFLVLETLGLPIDDPGRFANARLLTDERTRVVHNIHRRMTERIPAAYIVGKAYIQGYPFMVTQDVIIPRSYLGELLFADQLADLLPCGENLNQITRVLDLCTGSGCLAILAAQIFPGAQIDATDLSDAALKIARANVDYYGLQTRVNLHQGDLFAALENQKYDLILANPPYVTRGAVAAFPSEYAAEPQIAHLGGDDGMDIVHKIIAGAPQYLNPGGVLLCEIGIGRNIIETAYPEMTLTWIDTANASGEVFMYQP